MLRHYLTLMLMLATFPALAAEDPDIRVLMTEAEFAASGLSSLSNEQIEAINHWLVRYTVEDSSRIRRTSPAVAATVKTDVRSRIDGEFNGWDGYTQFRLQNGQVWETNTTRSYSYTAVNPEVVITRNFLLIYRMTIVETGQTISVRRIE